jgi:hypothetical protein
MYNVPCILDNFNDISNDLVRERVKHYLREGEDLFLFPEQTFIFKISNKIKFLHFLQEWENLYNIILEISPHQNYECIDVCLACQRANFPIRNIKEYLLVESRKLFLSRTPQGDVVDSLI